ncbi:winged helix-turn-helix domain-containing protein [Pseudoalteromonas sp. 5Ae-yellow]|uniref:winged helix-turn-helix domain-containing protein n=1 Tax=Pseudoalteromonas sp. 5Ae-yellow TaxID=2759847 RepID=UPI0015F3D62A|nr:winged helix-turn-helix domain-containing protein [Pseudoalteromonas sp. 5Ae-yellow]MBA6410894.1 winged helix-turn-helix domain-containing protein [Pseudoalteromonas sp. 5Ae-yellow]
MRYKFNNFEFDSTSCVLKKNGDDLAIRHNEAKVLKLLLEHSNHVFSKEDILSHVWKNKVVSEQAVFQSISNLRRLLGNHAIKTFSKRGYQWQLQIDSKHSDVEAHCNISQNKPLQHENTLSKPKSRNHWITIALSGIALLVFTIIINNTDQPQTDESSVINISYIAISNQRGTETFKLNDTELFSFTELPQLNTAHFQVSAEFEYPLLAKEHPLILSGTIRTHHNLTYIDFILKGPFADWQGQLSGVSQQAALNQLQQHLQQPVILELLNKAQTLELKQANLSIAHQQAPHDLIILGHLANTYIMMGELDKAMVMANKLEKIAISQNKTHHVGNALLFQSEVLIRKELFDLSKYKLSNAIKQFQSINDLHRQADAWFTQSWIDHNQDNYQAIKQSLLNSVQLAFDAQDKRRELSALTYLSVLAHKHQQEDDKYLYLQQAENKMKAYQIPNYHFAIVPYHYAIFAKSLQDKEPHLKQVLELATLTPDFWAAQSSRQQLMEYYINQNNLAEAQNLINDITTDNAKNSYLKTLLAQALKNDDAFTTHAQRTFEQAELAGDLYLSLDMALLICSSQSMQDNYDFYSQYINKKGTDYWRRNNEKKLLALNL